MKYSEQDMREKFRKIKDYYSRIVEETGKVKVTGYGVWGGSDCDIIFNFFKKIKLQDYENIVDLGSGDGRVVLIASLFTQAIGFEMDKQLMRLAKEGRDALGIDAEFRTEDFYKENLSRYDCMFIYPDKHSYMKMRSKFLRELKGKLFVYKIFKPNYLKKKKDYYFGKIVISEFENPEKPTEIFK
ncbi:hypothetical protein GF336_00130 [Candidatus Woesearchaeota archaeon]|nr:hypothetical protein [Candidatus Woesearchaeota archaeon]